MQAFHQHFFVESGFANAKVSVFYGITIRIYKLSVSSLTSSVMLSSASISASATRI